MEIHSVLPEERARDPKGETLPWAIRYSDSSRNARQAEESGPFGRNRSLRLTGTGSRTPRARTGTTPVRQKENSAVADFGRILAKEQAQEEERNKPAVAAGSGSTTTGTEAVGTVKQESVATECVLSGYASKASEWKVLSKFERIVSPGIICEDYSREDPNLFLSTNSPLAYSRASIVVHRNLSRDAIAKARTYRGGNHWIKITFDSYQAAERACSFSPVEIDGHLVRCEMWAGRDPVVDAPNPVLPGTSTPLLASPRKVRTLTPASSASVLGKDSAIAGFERAMHTLPRSQTMPDAQYAQPLLLRDDISVDSATASSATALEASLSPPPLQSPTSAGGLRSRSVPHLPSQSQSSALAQSEFMTAVPRVRRAVLRPASLALAPRMSFAQRMLAKIPLVSWFVGRGKGGDVIGIGEGPMLKDDGTWDDRNGWYWTFWHVVDGVLGTDFCGLKDD